MEVELPYGEASLSATLPERTRTIANTELVTLPPVEDLEATVRQALAAPLGLPRIRHLVKPGGRVTIAFDDATVASYGPIRGVAIRAVLEELEAAGVPHKNVTLICANALHRMLRREELARIIGHDLVTEFGPRLICHDAEDPEQLVDLGQTREHGYEVEVHRLVAESDLTVYVNARYNRGFSSGWKSVCVGFSTRTSSRTGRSTSRHPGGDWKRGPQPSRRQGGSPLRRVEELATPTPSPGPPGSGRRRGGARHGTATASTR